MSMIRHRIGRSVSIWALAAVTAFVCTGFVSAQEGRPKVMAKVIRVAKKLPTFNNADFYTADGKFNEEAAKKAYFDLMDYYNYPVNDTTRKNLFVSDMGLGKFTEVGLAVVIQVNEKEANYAALEIFLLPNQMIPEHWHVAIPEEGVKEKMESWVVRYGTTFTYGVGEPTEKLSVTIPECQKDCVTVRHELQLKPGEFTGIKKALDKHWQMAGPEGVILTEVATYHDGKAVRFTDSRIKF